MNEPSPTHAITIHPVWAWAIAAGFKTIENRPWRTNYRGALYIHAGKKLDASELCACAARLQGAGRSETPPALSDLRTGALIAIADVIDCGRFCDDPWANPAEGMFHFKLGNVRALPEPIPMRGQLGLWRV